MSIGAPGAGAVLADLGAAERLACAYAEGQHRAAYQALLALDGVLLRIALTAREPLPAQLKLAWWREACAALPERREHPVLVALGASWPEEAGVLVGLVDAWEEVAVGDDLAKAADTLAARRGAAMAACGGEPPAPALAATRCWTLVSLADQAHDAEQRALMLGAARSIAVPVMPRALRPVAVLAGLAQRAAARGRSEMLGDRWSPLAAIRLGIFGR